MGLARQAVRGLGHAALMPLEIWLGAGHDRPPAPPPLFIVGAPRSGTSLVYEALVSRYRTAYFSNLAHRFYATPVAATWIGRRGIAGRRPVWSSDYGHIAGWFAPNEGGWIWRRWLDDGDWVDETALAGLNAGAIRRAVDGVAAVLDAPFVNKNVMHSNRVRLLDALFPGCLFIEVVRDPAETVRSILRARAKSRGPAEDAGRWWSVRPSNAAAAAGGDHVDMAIVQVRGVAADIERDTAHLRRRCLIRVDYGAFCRDPEAVLAGVAEFAGRGGVGLAPRGEPLAPFRLSPSRPLEKAVERRLAAAF